MTITINTTGIRQASASATNAARRGTYLALATQLGAFKAGTIPIMGKKRFLSEKDKVSATNVVRKMQEYGWLTEEDKVWCSEQGIEI